MSKEHHRGRMIELRAAERDLVATIQQATQELEANRAEQAHVQHLLVTDTQTSIKLPASNPRSARRTLARLGTFTMSEAQAKLGWKRPKVKELIEIIETETPPVLERRGTFERERVFQWIGQPIEDDPAADLEAAGQEAVREWARAQRTRFTPGEAARACDTTRTTALRMLRHLESLGALVDESPTADMVIFAPAVNGTVAEAPQLHVVSEPEVFSRVPEIQEILAAAKAAGFEITSSEKFHAVESPTTRVVIPTTPQSKRQMLEDRAKIRRMGAQL